MSAARVSGILGVELVSVCKGTMELSVEFDVLFELAVSDCEEDKLTLFVELIDMGGSEKFEIADSLLYVVVSAVTWRGDSIQILVL